MRPVLPDLSPWCASRDFRLLWLSGTVTMFGSVFTMTAVPLQIAHLTGDPLAVGAIGLAELLPTILFGLYGGVLADRFDRKTLAVWTEVAAGVVSALLLLNALLDTPLIWPLFGAAACAAALQGLQQPALAAMVPRFVARDHLAAAASLASLRGTVAVILGPAAAGLTVSLLGAATAYAIDLATFAVSLMFLCGLSSVRAEPGSEIPTVLSGARYALGRRDLLVTYAADLSATVFALPTALYPFLAVRAGTPWAVGLLYSAPAVGALIATLTGGWTSRVRDHLGVALAAAGVTGAAMVGAAFAPGLPWLLAALALAGAANWAGDVARETVWNRSVPDRLRGRLAGIELLIGAAGPAIGDVRAGATARAGVRLALWTGGVACLTVTALLAPTAGSSRRNRRRPAPPRPSSPRTAAS